MRLLIIAVLFVLAACGDNPPKSFDDCMKRYSPPPGPNLGFMAAQAACQTFLRASTDQQRTAALCLAAEADAVKDARDFDSSVKKCFGGVPVGRNIAQMQCVMPNYLRVRSQADLQALMRKCS